MVRGTLPAAWRAVAACAVVLAVGEVGVASGVPHVLVPADERERIGSGAWSYFGDPRAVYAGGQSFVGWVGANGRVAVASVAADRVRVRTIDRIGRDDHNNPSLHVTADGRIVAFYAPHDGKRLPRRRARKMYYRVTRRPYDISSWTRPRPLRNVPPLRGYGDRGFAYPNPVQVGSRLWVFFRGGSWWPCVTTTRDLGRWTKPVNVIRGIRGHRPYVKYAPSGGAGVFMAFTQAHPNSHPTSLFFLRLSASGEASRADWTHVGDLGHPPSYKRADLVYRYRRGRGRAWVMDVAATHDGAPLILYTRDRGSRAVLYRARWTRREWKNDRILAPGYGLNPRSWYTGGATFDHEDPSTVYLARRTRSDRPMEIEAWSAPTNDDGPWHRRLVTRNSVTDNWRPVSPRGDEGYDVFWWSGRYLNFKAFKTTVFRGTPGEEVPPMRFQAGRWSNSFGD